MIDKIKCPNCSHEFDVEEALAGKLESHFKKEYERKIAEQAEVFQRQKLALEKEKDDFELKKEKENELFKEKLEQRIVREKEKIEKQTLENFELQLKSLQNSQIHYYSSLLSF